MRMLIDAEPSEPYPPTTVCDLITARQRALYKRYWALQQVVREDGGTMVEDVCMDTINDELEFLVELAHSYLAQLQATTQALRESVPA
jgi:hypothetical protein